MKTLLATAAVSLALSGCLKDIDKEATKAVPGGAVIASVSVQMDKKVNCDQLRKDIPALKAEAEWHAKGYHAKVRGSLKRWKTTKADRDKAIRQFEKSCSTPPPPPEPKPTKPSKTETQLKLLCADMLEKYRENISRYFGTNAADVAWVQLQKAGCVQ